MGKITMAKLKLWQEEIKTIAMFFGALGTVGAFFYKLFHGTLPSQPAKEVVEVVVRGGGGSGGTHRVVREIVRSGIHEHAVRNFERARMISHASAPTPVPAHEIVSASQVQLGLTIAIGIIALIFIYFFFRYLIKVMKKHMNKENNHGNHVGH
jgi:hypothetical protein